MNQNEVLELLKRAKRQNDMVAILPDSDTSKVLIKVLEESTWIPVDDEKKLPESGKYIYYCRLRIFHCRWLAGMKEIKKMAESFMWVMIQSPALRTDCLLMLGCHCRIHTGNNKTSCRDESTTERLFGINK